MIERYQSTSRTKKTNRLQILPVFDGGPDHGAEVDEEGDDDEHEDGHVVADADGREDEVEVDDVRLRQEARHEGRQVGRAAGGERDGRVVHRDADPFPDLSVVVKVVQTHRVHLERVVGDVEVPIQFLKKVENLSSIKS